MCANDISHNRSVGHTIHLNHFFSPSSTLIGRALTTTYPLPQNHYQEAALNPTTYKVYDTRDTHDRLKQRTYSNILYVCTLYMYTQTVKNYRLHYKMYYNVSMLPPTSATKIHHGRSLNCRNATPLWFSRFRRSVNPNATPGVTTPPLGTCTLPLSNVKAHWTRMMGVATYPAS